MPDTPAASSRRAAHSLCIVHYALCIAALAAVAARAETTDSYVRDGLLACWDGIENAGAAANWIDVVGGKSIALSNVTVAADSIVFKGNKTSYGVLDEAGTTATFGAAANGTIEIVYASATGTGSQFILQSSSGSGIAYGFYKTSTLIACNASAPTATFTSGTATNTAAVRYSSAKPASYVVNGTELTNGGNSYWSGANKTTVVGNRTSHADSHFNGAIYCIRLYDRQLSDAEIAANLAVDRHRFLEGRAVYGEVSVAQTNGVWYATAELLKGSGDIDLHVVSPQGATNVVSLSNGVVVAPATFTTAIPGIAADPVYSAFASIASGAETNFTRVANIFNSPVSIEVTADATPTTPGVFTVSRPAVAGATNMPLTVAFTLSGTAVAGTHYAPLPETVTIPAGAASATVKVATLAQTTATTSLTLSLSGDNHLPGNPASATMAVNSVFFTGDWFVAKDGDDQNSGASRAEAKATISAAYACLTNIPAARVGNRLVICDGEWEVSESFVLSNGWSLVSEHGRAYTTLKPTVAISLFTLASADSSVSGFTADLNTTYPKGSAPALLASNPVGTIDDCTVRNLKPASATSAVRLVSTSSSAAEVFIRNCSFENCSVSYRSALFWIEGGKIHFDGCSFTDCHGRNPSGAQYYNYGMIYIISSGSTIRNCLFKRCTAYGTYPDAGFHSSVVSIGNNANSTVENCTFVSCSALSSSKGGALACRSVLNESHMAGTAKNCLAVNCKNDFGPAGLMHGFTYSHCAQETALDGEGNVVVNESNTTWQNPLNDSYFPESGPAVDGGETLDWMASATDLRGNARVIGSAPDIGCHEYPGYPRNTYYVAKDGDDANSGLTRAEAKATLAAGYALLHGEDETLMICDGTWDYAPDGSLVLTNGWTLTSEHGANATTLKATQSGYLFRQPEKSALVKGITFNLANVAFGTDAVSAPKGVISSCVFSNSNHRTAWGSARMMSLAGGTPLVTNCLFRDCRNTLNGVSVIWVSGSTTAKIVDCSFVDCNSGTSGTALGAIYCYEGSTTMRNCLFLRCKSKGCSQGTYAPNGGHIVAVGRSATLYADNCSFIDCTITGSEKAGALGTTMSGGKSSTLVATNCFAYGNSNAAGPANLMTNIFPTCSATFSHCASDYLLPGDGNVVLTDSNFSYRSRKRDDYTVKMGPTINAGTNLEWMVGATDLMGRPRVVGKIVDIGCFELETSRATRFMVR